MNKKEIAEIKKQYTQEKCPGSRIAGCYVDGEKRVIAQFREAFLSIPEEEFFKYLNIFRKSMSGTVGKNLLTMEFPLEEEEEGGKHELLMKLKYTGLQDDAVLEEFYEKVINCYNFVGNYLILLLHGTMDIVGKTSDNIEMDDASDEVYEHFICCICPVTLSKPGLSYNPHQNCFENNIQEWMVQNPSVGFLFPAFHDRSADIHSLLYYNAKPEEPATDLVDGVLGCVLPMTAGNQKETFSNVMEKTLGEECSFEMVRTIHDTLNEMMEEKKDEPELMKLDKGDVKRILEQSGVTNEQLSTFDDMYDVAAGTHDVSFVANNVVNTRKFEIKTPDVVIQVNPERTDLVETKEVDGKRCLVIEISEEVVVNGIAIK